MQVGFRADAGSRKNQLKEVEAYSVFLITFYVIRIKR